MGGVERLARAVAVMDQEWPERNGDASSRSPPPPGAEGSTPPHPTTAPASSSVHVLWTGMTSPDAHRVLDEARPSWRRSFGAEILIHIDRSARSPSRNLCRDHLTTAAEEPPEPGRSASRCLRRPHVSRNPAMGARPWLPDATMQAIAGRPTSPRPPSPCPPPERDDTGLVSLRQSRSPCATRHPRTACRSRRARRVSFAPQGGFSSRGAGEGYNSICREPLAPRSSTTARRSGHAGGESF